MDPQTFFLPLGLTSLLSVTDFPVGFVQVRPTQQAAGFQSLPPTQMRQRGPSQGATRAAVNARPITGQSAVPPAGGQPGPRPMGPGVNRPPTAMQPGAQVSCLHKLLWFIVIIIVSSGEFILQRLKTLLQICKCHIQVSLKEKLLSKSSRTKQIQVMWILTRIHCSRRVATGSTCRCTALQQVSCNGNLISGEATCSSSFIRTDFL